MSHKDLPISGLDLSSAVFTDCPRRDVKTLGGITKIASAHDIVSLEHASSPVPRHLHRNTFRNSRAHEITDRGATEVVQDTSRVSCFSASNLECNAEGLDRLARPMKDVREAPHTGRFPTLMDR